MGKDFWFLKTHFDKKRTRMVPLPQQMLKAKTVKGDVDEDIDETFNVQADKSIRNVFPIGTHFGTDKLEKKADFYQAGIVYVMLKGDLKGYPEAPKEMWDEYEKLKLRIGLDATEVITKRGEVKKTTKVSYLDKLKGNSKYAPPSIEEGFYVDLDKWYLLLRNIKMQVPTMLVGPTGSGKTELAKLVAQKLGLPFHVFDMGSMFDPVSGLLGVHRLNAKGVSEFEYAKFCTAIAEPSVTLLDELSRAPISTNNLLFPCLDVRKTLPVEIAGAHDAREIRVHDECSFLATANIGGEYVGTNTMDRALVDRFFMLELDYLTESQESQVLQVRTGIERSVAGQIVTVAKNIRQSYSQSHVSSSVSTRHTLVIADLIADGFSFETAMKLVLLPMYEGSETEGEKTLIISLIKAR